MRVPLTQLPPDATEAQVVLGVAGDVFRLSHELPPAPLVSQTEAVADGSADVDVPFGTEAIVFLTDGSGFVAARPVRVGQTFGDPYRVVVLDVSKAELTVTVQVSETAGPDPGDVQARAEVEWGDGSGVEIVDPPVSELTHTYAKPGHYSIHIRFGFETDPRPSYAHQHIVLD